MPYCPSFRAGRFDFTIVSVHIFEGSKDIREKEIDLLAEKIKKLSKEQATKVFDRDFFVVGDFNIKIRGPYSGERNIVLERFVTLALPPSLKNWGDVLSERRSISNGHSSTQTSTTT